MNRLHIDKIIQNVGRLFLATLVITILWMILPAFTQGLKSLSWEFLTQAPNNGGRSGGIAPIIISTFIILSICMTLVFPIGFMASVFFSEYLTKGKAIYSYLLNSLAAVPSIVFGLFGNLFFTRILHWNMSLLSGGCTLALMILPYFIHTLSKALLETPTSYREQAASLGLDKQYIIRKVLLPKILPSIGAAFVLSCGRALAETAVLLFTSGYGIRFPSSVFDSGRSLSIHIYDLAMNVSAGDQNAWGSVFVLLIFIFLFNGAFEFFTSSSRLNQRGTSNA